MRLRIILLGILLSIGTQAQTPYKNRPINFFVKVGPNITNLKSDELDGSTQLGYTAGAGVEFLLTENVYVMTGLNASFRNFKYKQTITTEANDATYHYQANPVYLQIPLHLGSRQEVNKMIHLTFNGGVYAAFGISGRLKKTFPSPDEKENYFNADRNSFDFGIGLGTGIEIYRVAFNFGLDFGLTQMNKKESKDVRNQNAYFTVGYVF